MPLRTLRSSFDQTRRTGAALRRTAFLAIFTPIQRLNRVHRRYAPFAMKMQPWEGRKYRTTHFGAFRPPPVRDLSDKQKEFRRQKENETEILPAWTDGRAVEEGSAMRASPA